MLKSYVDKKLHNVKDQIKDLDKKMKQMKTKMMTLA